MPGGAMAIYRRCVPGAAIAACALAIAHAAIAQPADAVYFNPGDVKWGPAPPTLPNGAKVVVLYGDPAKSGPFVLRMMAPPGYRVGPHWHSQAEHLTVISGALYVGD